MNQKQSEATENQFTTPTIFTTAPPTSNSFTSASGSSTCSTHMSSSPIDIPTHWRPDTIKCIHEKSLSTECRNDIVRTLVSMLISRVGPKPTKSQCEQVARKLILKHPFMKDDMGDGYVSFVTPYYSRYSLVSFYTFRCPGLTKW